nr:hypothetical protein [Streptomyces tailanensis]
MGRATLAQDLVRAHVGDPAVVEEHGRVGRRRRGATGRHSFDASAVHAAMWRQAVSARRPADVRARLPEADLLLPTGVDTVTGLRCRVHDSHGSNARPDQAESAGRQDGGETVAGVELAVDLLQMAVDRVG